MKIGDKVKSLIGIDGFGFRASIVAGDKGTVVAPDSEGYYDFLVHFDIGEDIYMNDDELEVIE